MTQTLERIQSLLGSGQVDEAQKALASAGGGLSDTDRCFCEGLVHEKRHRWHDAAEAYQDALEKDETHPAAAFRLAYMADRLGDDDLAIDLYEGCADHVPVHVNALMNLAVLYEDVNRFEDALTCVERIVAEDPNHSRALLFQKDLLASLDMYYDEEGERVREKRDALLDTPISEFELSVRSRNCLKQMDIHTLGDLLSTTAAELLAYKNFGETSLHEIEAMLTQKSLRLGQLLDDYGPETVGQLAVTSQPVAPTGILARSVSELELSVRSRKCLMRLGINSVHELVQRSEAELLAIKNFGMTSLAEIRRRLSEFNLKLRDD
ncbi:MAG: tetratricopeptide repeat protein [Phycisphaerales bacterium]|nr:tetratricopeptide repeat protein [Phycisphaerales bacterium]